MNYRFKPFYLPALRLAIFLTAGCFVLPCVSVQAQEAEAKAASRATLRLVEWQDAFRKLTDKRVPPSPKFRNSIVALGFLPGKSVTDFRLLVTLSPFASRETEGRPSLWSCDVSGKNPVKLLDAPGKHIFRAAASPNGNYVACVLTRETKNELWLVDVKTKQTRLIRGLESDAAFYWHTDNSLSLVRRSVPPTGKYSVATMEWAHTASDSPDPLFHGVSVLPPPAVLTPAPKTDWVTNAVPSHKGDRIALFCSPGQLEVRDATQAAGWLPPFYKEPQKEGVLQWSSDDKYVRAQASPYFEFRDTSTHIFQSGTDRNIDLEAKLNPILAQLKGVAESEFGNYEPKRAWVADSLWLPGSKNHKLLLFAYILPPFQACIPVPRKADEIEEFFIFLLDADTETITRVANTLSIDDTSAFIRSDAASPDGRYVLVQTHNTTELYQLN